MTYRAEVAMRQEENRDLALTSEEDVAELVSLLHGEGAHTATLTDGENDPAVDALVHGGYGYLLYAGDELLAYSVGDPDSPGLEESSEAGFPAGSGLSLDTFRTVLTEFVTGAGAIPATIEWQGVDLG